MDHPLGIFSRYIHKIASRTLAAYATAAGRSTRHRIELAIAVVSEIYELLSIGQSEVRPSYTLPSKHHDSRRTTGIHRRVIEQSPQGLLAGHTCQQWL